MTFDTCLTSEAEDGAVRSCQQSSSLGLNDREDSYVIPSTSTILCTQIRDSLQDVVFDRRNSTTRGTEKSKAAAADLRNFPGTTQAEFLVGEQFPLNIQHWPSHSRS